MFLYTEYVQYIILIGHEILKYKTFVLIQDSSYFT